MCAALDFWLAVLLASAAFSSAFMYAALDFWLAVLFASAAFSSAIMCAALDFWLAVLFASEIFICALASALAAISAAFASFRQTSLTWPALSSHCSLATE